MPIKAFTLLLSLLLAVSADQDAFVGVNIGTALSDMPNPTQVAVLLKSQQIRYVRLYDADQAMLLALSDTGIQVSVTVPNQKLLPPVATPAASTTIKTHHQCRDNHQKPPLSLLSPSTNQKPSPVPSLDIATFDAVLAFITAAPNLHRRRRKIRKTTVTIGAA